MPETVFFDPEYELAGGCPVRWSRWRCPPDALTSVGSLGTGSRVIGVWAQAGILWPRPSPNPVVALAATGLFSTGLFYICTRWPIPATSAPSCARRWRSAPARSC